VTFGKQTRFCPNCGKQLYDSKVEVNHVQSMMCSKQCMAEWEIKYARCILGKDGNEN